MAAIKRRKRVVSPSPRNPEFENHLAMQCDQCRKSICLVELPIVDGDNESADALLDRIRAHSVFMYIVVMDFIREHNEHHMGHVLHRYKNGQPFTEMPRVRTRKKPRAERTLH